jgi:hypothetical protein
MGTSVRSVSITIRQAADNPSHWADLTRDTLWPVLGEYGMRPVSQVAVDEVWSALRFRPLKVGEPPSPAAAGSRDRRRPGQVVTVRVCRPGPVTTVTSVPRLVSTTR